MISGTQLHNTTPGIHSSSIPDISRKTTSDILKLPTVSLSSSVRLRTDTTYTLRPVSLTSPHIQTTPNSIQTLPDSPLFHHQSPPLSRHQSTSPALSKHQSTSSALSKHQSTNPALSKHQSTSFPLSKPPSTSTPLSKHQSTSPSLSHYQSPHSILSTNEIVAAEVSTQFTHNPPGQSSSQFKIVAMTTPWTLIIRTTETTVVFGAKTTDNSELSTGGATSGDIIHPNEGINHSVLNFLTVSLFYNRDNPNFV